MFAGNKCDTPKEMRKVPKELVSNYVHYELPRLRAKVSGTFQLPVSAFLPAANLLLTARPQSNL